MEILKNIADKLGLTPKVDEGRRGFLKNTAIVLGTAATAGAVGDVLAGCGEDPFKCDEEADRSPFAPDVEIMEVRGDGRLMRTTFEVPEANENCVMPLHVTIMARMLPPANDSGNPDEVYFGECLEGCGNEAENENYQAIGDLDVYESGTHVVEGLVPPAYQTVTSLYLEIVDNAGRPWQTKVKLF